MFDVHSGRARLLALGRPLLKSRRSSSWGQACSHCSKSCAQAPITHVTRPNGESRGCCALLQGMCALRCL